MKPLLPTLLALALVIPGFSSHAAPAGEPGPNANAEALVADVRRADDERVTATIAVDRDRLEAVLSEQLAYAHSNGKLDTRASLIEGLVTRRLVYERFDYRQREFAPAAPGVVLMRGRVVVHVKNGDHSIPLDLSYLAVWREERGRWRMLAWQSSRNPDAN